MEEAGSGLLRQWRGAAALFASLFVLAAAPAVASADIAITSPADGSILQSAPDFEGTRSLSPMLDPAVAVDISASGYHGSLLRTYSDQELLDMVEGWGPFAAPDNDLPPFGSMPDGHYTVEARQAGLLGEADGVATAEFDLDSAAPQTSFTSKPDTYSRDVTPGFGFSHSDPAPSAGFDRFECDYDGGGWAPCSSGDTFSAPEGNHTLSVRAIDAAGNADPTPAVYSWMVDLTPPGITIDKPLNKDRYLLHHGPVPDYTCVDPLAGGPPPVASGIQRCDATPINSEDLGPHEFRVDARDRAGNTASKSVAYTIDPPDYGKFISDDDPIAYYRMDEEIGADVMKDRSGNGHDGVYQNGIALGRDGATACERRPHPPRACELAHPAENTAGFFGARDDHGYVNGISAPTTAYTMEAWVKPRDGADMMIMGHGGGGQLFISGGKLAFRQTQEVVGGGGPTLTPGQWWHVGATWNGSTTRLYVNGNQVASSSSANKPPSGTATFYVGYGEMAAWFHGDLDEAAYYGRALSAHAFRDRHKIGVAFDHPSIEAGASHLNSEGPNTDPESPKNDGLYAPAKVPAAEFDCDDPDGQADVASCTATADGNPIASGDPLPNGIGAHSFVVRAEDLGGNVYTHTHTYRVMHFADLLNADEPLAYYRLGDVGPVMSDASANGLHGQFFNDTDSGPVGISGDGDHARDFFGAGGYGFRNDIAAPRYGATLEAWVHPADGRDESIAGHGDAGELLISGGHFAYRHMGTTVTSSVPVSVGHWQQVVGVWDGVSIRIYVDGAEAGKAEATTRPSSVSTFYVGYGELAPWFYGAIDEIAYYGKALSADRVYQHYLADPPPADLAPVEAPVDPSDPDDPVDPGPGPDKPSTDPPSKPAPQMSAAVQGRVKIGKRVVKARYSCGSGAACAGRAVATVTLNGVRFRVGSKSFAAAAGSSGKLRFKMRKRLRRSVKSAQKRSAAVKLTAADGRLLAQG